MRRLYILLLALVLILQHGILAFPSYVSEQPNIDQIDGENPERDVGSSKKIIGSSVVTSVSVILNGDEPEYTDAVGKKVPKPNVPLQVASPINLLNPDRYEFYTFDDNGELVKRLMTMTEIQSIVANGDGEGPAVIHNMPMDNNNPEKNVQDIVDSVQNVLTREVEGQKNSNDTTPVLDTPDVSSSWSMILPAIFGNTGGDIFPQNKPQQVVMTPDSDIFESSTTSQKRRPPPRPKPMRKRPTTEATTLEPVSEPIDESTMDTTIPLKIETVTTNLNGEAFTVSYQADEVTEQIVTNVPTSEKIPIRKRPITTIATPIFSSLSPTDENNGEIITNIPTSFKKPIRKRPTTTEPTTTEIPQTTTNTHTVFLNNEEVLISDSTDTTQQTVIEMTTATRRPLGSKRKPNPNVNKIKKKTTTSAPATTQNYFGDEEQVQNKPIKKKPLNQRRTTTSAPEVTIIDYTEQQQHDQKRKPPKKTTTVASVATLSTEQQPQKNKPQQHKNKKPFNKRTTTVAPETTVNDFTDSNFNEDQHNKKKPQNNKIKQQNKKRTTTIAPETTTTRSFEAEEFTQLSEKDVPITYAPDLEASISIIYEQLPQTMVTTESTTNKLKTSPVSVTAATTSIPAPITTTSPMTVEEYNYEPITNKPTTIKVEPTSVTETKPSISPNSPTVGISSMLNTDDMNTKLSFDQIMQSLKEDISDNSSGSEEYISQSPMNSPPQMYNSAESLEKLTQIAHDKLSAVPILNLDTRTTTVEPESTTQAQLTKDDEHILTPEKLFVDIREPVLTELTTETQQISTNLPFIEQSTKIPLNFDSETSFTSDTTDRTTDVPITDLFVDSSTSYESNESGSNESYLHQDTTASDEESTTSLDPLADQKDQATTADLLSPITFAVESLLGGIINNSLPLNGIPTEENFHKINPIASDKNMTMSVYQQHAATYASKLEEPATTAVPQVMSENMKNELEILMSDVINQMTDRVPSTTEESMILENSAVDLDPSNQQLSSFAQISSSLLSSSQKVIPEMIQNNDEHAELQTSESQFVHKQNHRVEEETDSASDSTESDEATTTLNYKNEASTEDFKQKEDTESKFQEIEMSYTTTENIEMRTEHFESQTEKSSSLDSTTAHSTDDLNEMSESVEQSGEINIGSSSMEELLDSTTIRPESLESTELPGEFTAISMESAMIENGGSSTVRDQETTTNLNESNSEQEPEDSYIKLGETKTTEPSIIEEKSEPPIYITTTPIPTTTTTTTSTTTTKKVPNTLKPVSYFKQPSSPTEQKLVAFNSNINQQRPMVRPASLSNLKVNQNMATRPPVKLDPTANQSLGLEASTVGLDEDILKFSHLCNELAFSYWRAITSEKISSARSLVISPFALTSMLSMVFLGARGGTSGEMNEILKLDDMVTFNPHLVFKNITDTVEKAQDSEISSSAFVREIFSDRANGKVLNFFKEKTQQLYSGHVEEVNFNVVNDIIRRRTNLLVKRHTMGKVLEYLRTNSVWVNGPLATISANLFQTDCSRASITDRDGEMFFQVHPSIRQRRLIPIPAAVWKSGFTAAYDPEIDATIVAFGKFHETVSTLYIMPGQQGSSAPGDSLDRLEKNLMETAISKNSWSHMLKLLMERPGLEVQLPRFSHRSFVNASLGLQKMGLKGLFNSDFADLRGLTGSSTKDIYLSDMIQINTFSTCAEQKIAEHHHVEMYPAPPIRKRNKHVDANDEFDSSEQMIDFGSIVQDSTGRGFYDDLLDPKYLELPLPLRPRQARIPDAPRLRFDKPFLYFVRHNPTGMLLFMGRFNPRLLP